MLIDFQKPHVLINSLATILKTRQKEKHVEHKSKGPIKHYRFENPF